MSKAYTSKEKSVLSVFSRWSGCTKCDLGEQRCAKNKKTDGQSGNMVFGDGNVNADIMVIGVGPGEDEDAQECAFVGDSGDILDDHLSKLSIKRSDLFLMNIVACRPFSNTVDFKTKKSREEDRDPTPLEREKCRPMWQEIMYLVDPLIVVTMGKVATAEILGKSSVSMRELQGSIIPAQIPGKAIPTTYSVMPMHHPSYLSKSGDDFRGGPWHQAIVSWKRTIYFLDQLKNLYYGTPAVDRGFKDKDMFLIGDDL